MRKMLWSVLVGLFVSLWISSDASAFGRKEILLPSGIHLGALPEGCQYIPTQEGTLVVQQPGYTRRCALPVPQTYTTCWPGNFPATSWCQTCMGTGAEPIFRQRCEPGFDYTRSRRSYAVPGSWMLEGEVVLALHTPEDLYERPVFRTDVTGQGRWSVLTSLGIAASEAAVATGLDLAFLGSFDTTLWNYFGSVSEDYRTVIFLLIWYLGGDLNAALDLPGGLQVALGYVSSGAENETREDIFLVLNLPDGAAQIRLSPIKLPFGL